MRIVIIHQHYVVPRYQESIWELTKAYPNCEIHLIVPKSFKMGIVIEAQALNKNIRLHTLTAPFAKNGKQHFFFFIGLQKKLDEIKADLIWAQAPNSINTWQAAKYCEKNNVPLLLLRFSNYFRNYRKLHSFLDPRRYLYTAIRKYTYDIACGIVVIDDLVETVVKEEGFNGKIFKYMTMGVGADFFEIGKKRLKESIHPKNILFLGRLMPAKGVNYLIEAFKHIDYVDSTLTIVGSGPCSEDLYEQGRSSSKIKFQDFIAYEQVPDFLSRYDIIVLPSIIEGKALEQFGRVLVEGQAAGLVPIGSNIGGIPNAVRDGGILVPERSVDALKTALLDILSQPMLYEDLRMKGYQSALNNFSEKEIAKNMYNTFKTIIYA